MLVTLISINASTILSASAQAPELAQEQGYDDTTLKPDDQSKSSSWWNWFGNSNSDPQNTTNTDSAKEIIANNDDKDTDLDDESLDDNALIPKQTVLTTQEEKVIDINKTIDKKHIYNLINYEHQNLLDQRMRNITNQNTDILEGSGMWGHFSGGIYNIADKNSMNFYTGSIGYDQVINQKVILGAAISIMHINTKDNDNKSYNTPGYIASIYTAFYDENVILNANAFLGKLNMSELEKVYVSKDKFTTHYGLDSSIGYQFKINSHVITPKFGLSYYKPYQGDDNQKIYAINARFVGQYQYLIDQINGFDVLPGVTTGVLLNNTDLENNKTLIFVKPNISLKKNAFDFNLSYSLSKGYNLDAHSGSINLILKF